MHMYAFETADIHTVNFMMVILLQTVQSGCAPVFITLHDCVRTHSLEKV